MARRRRPEPVPLDYEPPDWFWEGCSLRRWLREHDGVLDGYHAAKQEWRERCREWLEVRGLVMYGMSGLTWEDYKRVEREEPHRILRRP
ncbi:hypothetical protein [Streptomyces sp. NPDC088350]|uniref:hypothetical protein n=1 Tax=Streptomyces sp. NPDC088350 TaxID=3365854 RepID=UPI0037FFFBC1